ncbi:uncharacterized protein Tco025E_05549 [Trypanosoma conorhini]|uniref:Uncharacterized protein n=1 Tax=Trypanosoma conorhini TaxID=83891 RepID=A0A422PC97_9TRYP|nr:uncharacterized protein Tco025E_05549 [Trypanosoma conorhini]RNF15326.1 hypothetical protein Tco025E_05549 [Trypanosoma conorhini]
MPPTFSPPPGDVVKMTHRRVREGPSPSPKRARAGLSPPPLPPRSLTLERDAKALQAMLQEIDEAFHLNDDDNERRLRLRQLGEQQMVLQRLCEAALQTEEGLGGSTVRPRAGADAANGRPAEAGIVLTPRSLESLSTYGDVGATVMGRSASRTDAGSLPRSAPLLPPYGPSKEALSATRTAQPFCKDSVGISPPLESPVAEAASTRAPARRETLPPLSSPALVEDTALEKERRLIEEFLGVAGAESAAHPYAAAGNERRGPAANGVVPFVPRLNLQRLGGNPPTRGPAAQDDLHAENFDVREEEQLLRCLVQREPQRSEDPLPEACTAPISRSGEALGELGTPSAQAETSPHARERSFSAPSDIPAAPRRNGNEPHRPASSYIEGNAATSAEKRKDEEVPASHTGETQELLQENIDLHTELETQDVALRELTRKTETLARHLVKSMRDRTQLQTRVEELEASVARANYKVQSLQRAAEEQNKVTCAVDVWRAAVHAKERELRICEEELCRLRGIVEERVMRSGKALLQHDAAVDLAQVKSDVEELLLEIASTHVLRREAEAHAERISDELEAAQSHIQLLDNRLAEAERTVASQRLQEMRDRFLPDTDASQAASALSTLPTFSMPPSEAVAAWPFEARRELARLAAYAEGLVAQHAESDRYAELRLSHARFEKEELGERCRVYESGVKQLEDETEALRRERVVWKLGEQRWRQQLLEVQEDAALVTELLQTAVANAERVLESVALTGVDPQVKTEVEMFVKGVMHDWDTVRRFTTALQRMQLCGSQSQQQKEVGKLPLSTATRTRREFVLQAVEAAMAQKAPSSSASLPPRTQAEAWRHLAPAPSSLPGSFFIPRSPVTRSMSTMEGDSNWKEELRAIHWSSHAPHVEAQSLSPPLPTFAEDVAVVTREGRQRSERQREVKATKPRARRIPPPAESPRGLLPQPSRDAEGPFFFQRCDHAKLVTSTAKIELSQPPACREANPVSSTLVRRELSFTETPAAGGSKDVSVALGTPAELSRGDKRTELPVPEGATEARAVEHPRTDGGEAGARPVQLSSNFGAAMLTTCSEDVEEVVEPLELGEGTVLRGATPTTSFVSAVTAATTLATDTGMTVEEKALGGGGPRLQPECGLRLRANEVSPAKEQTPRPATSKDGVNVSTSSVPGVITEAMKDPKKINRVSRKTWEADVDDTSNEPRLHMVPPRMGEQKKQASQREQLRSSSPTVKPRQEPGPSQPNKDDTRKESYTALYAQSETVEVTLSDAPKRIKGSAGEVPALASSPLGPPQGHSLAPSLEEPQRIIDGAPADLAPSEETGPEAQRSATEASLGAPQEPANEIAPVVKEVSNSGRGRRPPVVMDFPSLCRPTHGPGGRRKPGEEKS